MLSDATRLHLLWLLAQEESDVGSLAERCAASRTAVSQHLAKLRLAGLVDTRREGRYVHYRLRDGHLRRLVQEALSHADHRVSGEAPTTDHRRPVERTSRNTCEERGLRPHCHTPCGQ